MNKRDFIKGSGALAAAASVNLIGSLEAVAGFAEKTRIAAAIFDERYGDARAFAAELGRAGAAQFQTNQDVGRLCYGALREYFARPGVQLAGLTPHSDVYVLQSFAAERRLKLLFEGLHDARRGSTLSHQLQLSERMAGTAGLLEQAGSRWSTALARVVAGTPFEGRATRTERVATRTRRSRDNPGMLVSWVLG
jgi:hypothetical protein